MGETSARTRRGVLAAGALCAALLTGGLSPSWAAGRGDSTATAVVGGFGLGDGLEGLIDPQTGAFSFDLPLGPIHLRWSSGQARVDRFGFGAGWAVAGVGVIDTNGGVRVFPSSGGAYEANASTTTGLDAYPNEDVRFSQVPGVVPARADGLMAARGYAYSLTELGGTTVRFDDAGFPLTKFDAHGNRFDWQWGDDADHRLVRVVDQIGVVTELDWSAGDRVVAESRAGASSAVVSASVELGDDGVSAAVDPAGGRVEVRYGPDGLVTGVGGVSGAATEVSWQPLGDSTKAVEHVRVVDAATDEELSLRSWRALAGVSSQWPVVGGGAAGTGQVTGAAGAATGYRTELADGPTRVESEYDAQNRLVRRAVTLMTASAQWVAQEQKYDYAATNPDRPVRVADPS